MVGETTEQGKKRTAEQKLIEQGWEKVHEGCYRDRTKRNDLYSHLMGQD